jgi:group II intron reverse transcriptase/maturase
MAKRRLGQSVSPKLLEVAKRARLDPKYRFLSLAYLLDEQALERSFKRIRKDAAKGVDGVTKEQYGVELGARLRDLHQRLKAGRYRHQPIRRVLIPKGAGKTRPIGVSTIEDKVVQGAVREVLEAIYEQDFRKCSYGFRPGRSAHDALRAVNKMSFTGNIAWILEADIKSFFDSLVRAKLLEMLQERVADGSLLRLVGKCLHVGVLEGERYMQPGEGTVQGSVISPLLGNVYLHHVLDRWFEDEVRGQLAGNAQLIRYADDFVIGFARLDDAEKFLALLKARFAAYGLTLHDEKTRLVAFRRPPRSQTEGKGPGNFDLLGFTVHWRRGRGGRWVLGMKTQRSRYQRSVRTISELCRSQRHDSLERQHDALSQRLRGHYGYFGVNGNVGRLEQIYRATEKVWFKWLRRRSQRARRLTWERFRKYLEAHPLPQPRITVQIWA